MAENGWEIYQKLVLHEISAQRKLLSDLSKTVNNINVEIGKLKVKSGIWGLLGGSIPILIAVGIKLAFGA